jgi:hypothetical protein
MGFFSELWDFIKYALKKVVDFIKKVFSLIYHGIKFVVQCIVSSLILLKNSWVGKIVEGLSFIFDLLDFLEDKGADVDAQKYKDELLDMNLQQYGRHTYNVQIS